MKSIKASFPYLVIVIATISLLLLTCGKIELKPVVNLSTGTVSNISYTTCSVSGTISSVGEGIIQHGFCWSTSSNPSINDTKVELGAKSTTGSFTTNLTMLTQETIYYIKAYATSNSGTVYGEAISFETLAVIPGTVSTIEINSITKNSAKCEVTITDDGGAPITARGICWSKSENPTISDSKITNGSGTGSFTSELINLSSSTKYYVKAYATNSAGTAYGNELSFTTLCAAPSATTLAATNIGTISATLNGTVNANNSSTNVTYEYGKTTSYGSTITATPGTVSGSSNTSVSASLTGLEPNTLYYYRVRVESCGGTINGDDQTFQTLCLAPSATIGGYASSYENTQIGGTVNANNSSTTVTFEYGTTTSFGNSEPANQSPVTGTSNITVSTLLTELAPNTRYYYRVKAVNCGGTTYSGNFDFTTPLCPEFLTLTHTAGNVSPVTKKVTYGIVKTNITGEDKCWITQNLGADKQGGSATDVTGAARGWFWQFNKKQGYKHDGQTRTPNSTWIRPPISEQGDWTASNDPCRILLGTGWRIPTKTEWNNAKNQGGWSNYKDAFASILKLHAAGSLNYLSGSLWNTGSYGSFWSSNQYYQYPNPGGWYLGISNTSCDMYQYSKAVGQSIRCIKD